LREHMRLYPRLDTPIVAFRNRGDLHFEDVTPAWGTDQPGVHHALALADLDRDGAVDLVVNNLGSAAGIYRNQSTRPRVAVRLQGRPPNTQGIGAKVRLLGGAVPLQSQEIICGGRYMAGSEAMLVFAAGPATNRMTLEVTWRSGQITTVTNVGANRLYEIAEEKSVVSGQSSVAGRPDSSPAAGPQQLTTANGQLTKLFEDVSDRLRHIHHEDPF